MSSKESFTPNGVWLPFHGLGSTEPLAWICLAKLKQYIMWHVYILQCADKNYYVGCTNDIKRSISDHNSHKICYTRDKTPVKLIAYISFTDKYKVFEFERYLK